MAPALHCVPCRRTRRLGMKSKTRLQAAIDRLAACVENGQLLASMEGEDLLNAAAEKIEESANTAEKLVDVANRRALAWEMLYNERNGLCREAEDRLEEVRRLLKQNKCDCDYIKRWTRCDCESCLACRIGRAISR